MASPQESVGTYIPVPANSLPIGTHLYEYEIQAVLGDGGFGIVYLAKDTALGRDVAIKEFLPISHAVRVQENKVQPRGPEHEVLFEKGLQSFIAEARILAQFRNPHLVEVLRFWKSNGTAYIVMPYYQGKTLRELIQKGYRVTSQAELFNIIMPLLDGLSQVHKVGCYHRDISPDNIIILSSGSPLLLDFGAARHEIINQTEYSTVILKPGFAPIEQYGGKETAQQQGAWTDIYAFCAVAYQLITGVAPPASVARIMRDPLVSLSNQSDRLPLPQGILSAIDAGLQIQPENRPQSIEAFRNLLEKPQAPILATTEKDRMYQQNLSADIAVAAPTSELTAPVAEVVHHPADTPTESIPQQSKPLMPGKLWPAVPAAMVLGVIGYIFLTPFSGTKPSPNVEISGKETSDFKVASVIEKKDQPEEPATLPDKPPHKTNQDTTRTEATGAQNVSTLSPSASKAEAEAEKSFVESDVPVVIANERSNRQPDSAMQEDKPPKSKSALSLSRSTAEETVTEKSDKKASKPEPVRKEDTSPATGKIVVEAKPWGDVYVNGEMVGTAPPRVTLDAPAGDSVVEIRNDSATAYSRTVNVRAGRTVRVSHDFTQKNDAE